MNLAGASQFIANMNAYRGVGYLGHTNWELPPSNASCPLYNCTDKGNPMGILFYDQFGLSAATPAVPTPNVAVGPFRNLQPYIYWSCQAVTIQDPCDGVGPNMGLAEWAFSFGNGFLGTDRLEADYYVTAYFVGNRTSTSGPEIAEVANAESGTPIIAPNTWIVINGANLARDSRFWQLTDLLSGHLPTQLDGVSVTVNGKSAYVYEISPSQLIVLTPPDAISGSASVVVTNNSAASAPFTAQAAPISPSLFVASGGQYVVSTPSFVGDTGTIDAGLRASPLRFVPVRRCPCSGMASDPPRRRWSVDRFFSSARFRRRPRSPSEESRQPCNRLAWLRRACTSSTL